MAPTPNITLYADIEGSLNVVLIGDLHLIVHCHFSASLVAVSRNEILTGVYRMKLTKRVFTHFVRYTYFQLHDRDFFQYMQACWIQEIELLPQHRHWLLEDVLAKPASDIAFGKNLALDVKFCFYPFQCPQKSYYKGDNLRRANHGLHCKSIQHCQCSHKLTGVRGFPQ